MLFFRCILQEIFFSNAYFFRYIFQKIFFLLLIFHSIFSHLMMVSRGHCPAGDTGLPRPGAVVGVVTLSVTGIRWPQGRPLTTEADPVPQLGRLLLTAVVAAVLLLLAQAVAGSSLDSEEIEPRPRNGGNSFCFINQGILRKSFAV